MHLRPLFGIPRRPKRRGFGVLLCTGLVFVSGCQRSTAPLPEPVIATTTSYLEAAVYDLLGEDAPVLRLAEPGTCPGHFDIRPRQANQVRRCRLLVRFDFQRSLDGKLADPDAGGLRVAEVRVDGGMCHPETYLLTCRQAAAHLVEIGLCPPATAQPRLAAIASRMEDLGRQATNRVAAAGLSRTPVIASNHQRDFAEWLGLDVVGTFRAADLSSIGEIEAALAAGKTAQVKLVIANLPEGRRTADALAERLGARVAVFENFPAPREGRLSFDNMVRGNVEALLRTMASAAGGG